MSEQCCTRHDDLFMDSAECGLAGTNETVVCCSHCPEKSWYEENQPTRPVVIYIDMSDEDRLLYEEMEQ